MAQIQGQMEIVDRDWCDFAVWTPEGLKVTRVLRSEEYWQWMLVKLAEFWGYVQMDVPPPRAKRKPIPPSTDSLIVDERFVLF